MNGTTASSGKFLHGNLSYAVLGCAQRVHAALGPGFIKKVYQKALCHELAKNRAVFQAKAPLEVAYDGVLCGEFEADIFVDEKIIVELKAVDRLCEDHEAQILSYLKASGARVGLLLNFGQKSLVVRRFVR
ncbi:MAG: GxxExxY protein [Phycisphaerae bacterium]